MAISTDDYARMAADSYKNWPDGHAVDGADFEVELNGTEAIADSYKKGRRRRY
jgi:hypothetical protein